jgi:O-antigen/teichoic acid export membrane protein
LTANDYGKIVIIFSISNILLTIVQFGLPIYFQRQTAKEKKINLAEFNISIIFGLVSFVLTAFAILFVTSIFYDIGKYSLVILIHSFVFSFYFISLFNSLLLGLNEQKAQFQSYSISRIISVSILLLLLFFVKDINYYIAICSVGNAMIIFVLYKYIVNRFIEKGSKSEISFLSIKNLILLTIPLGIAATSNFLYDKIDVILISRIIDIEQVAYYNIAYGIYKSSHIFFLFILASGLSRISSLSKRKFAVVLFLKKYFLLLFLVSVLIFVTLIILAKTLILYVYGEKYYSSVWLLQLLSFSIIPLALNSLTGITLNGLGMFKENLIVVICALFINILINFILLNTLGIVGAVYATLITEVFILGVDLVYLRLKLL